MLVNEAWLKLADTPALAMTSRLHFKRIAARAMRQVLIETARRRRAQKRGSGMIPVTFDEAIEASVTTAMRCWRSMRPSRSSRASNRVRRRWSRVASSVAECR